jgi:hypothetical protein
MSKHSAQVQAPATITTDEIEQLKAQAAAELAASSTETPAQSDTTTTTESTVTTSTKPASIRQCIRGGLLNGKNTAEIAAELKAHFPTSAAAAKSVKHIAYYRAEMVKNGEIAKGTGVAPRAGVSAPAATSKVAELQSELAELRAMMAQLMSQNAPATPAQS